MYYRILVLTIIVFASTQAKEIPSKENITDTVKIGTQVWMSKNLNVDHYRNGELIPEVTDTLEWISLKTGAWCYYNNDSATGEIYGKLYNWYAVNDPRGLAPKGWHVPGNKEWGKLISNLGGEKVAGSKLKEAGTSHWKSPNTESTNEVGFTAIPGGWRSLGGIIDPSGFNYIGIYGNWWTSSESDAENAFYINLISMFTIANIYAYYKEDGFSVRCVRD
jgi:uncharacterized protein (TIGR02145 family)